MKVNPPGNEEITLSLTEVGKSGPNGEFFTWQICLLTLFVKINSHKNFRIYSKSEWHVGGDFISRVHSSDLSVPTYKIRAYKAKQSGSVGRPLD